MAAFVGFIVGENKIHFPWAIQGGPSPITYEDIANAGGAAAQWDAVRAAPPLTRTRTRTRTPGARSGSPTLALAVAPTLTLTLGAHAGQAADPSRDRRARDLGRGRGHALHGAGRQAGVRAAAPPAHRETRARQGACLPALCLPAPVDAPYPTPRCSARRRSVAPVAACARGALGRGGAWEWVGGWAGGQRRGLGPGVRQRGAREGLRARGSG